MAYEKYITEAFVCGSKMQMTSNKVYLLFTREAGMIWASAQSVREERSRHRYSLQDFSFVLLSLVHGKGGWRITGTEPIKNLYFEYGTREERGMVRSITMVLRRFLHGEEPNQALYDEVKSGLETLSGSDLEKFEVVATARILHILGYIAPKSEHTLLFKTPNTEEALWGVTARDIAFAKKAIEEAKTISHL